jgi:pentatricopeptide repeat protein
MGFSSSAIRITFLIAQSMFVFSLFARMRAQCLKVTRTVTPLRYELYPKNFHAMRSKILLSARRAKEEPAKSGELEAVYREIVLCVKNKEVDKALKLYDDSKMQGIVFKNSVYLAMLSLCQKAEHLSSAIKIFNDMIASEHPPSEQSYLALIRCTCDAGKIDDAMTLVKQMIEIGIETKLRTYQPILEVLCGQLQDPMTAISVLRNMTNQNLTPRSEQLTLVLETAGRNSSNLKNIDFKTAVDQLIANCSTEMLGLPWDDTVRITSAMNSVGTEVVVKNGILIESLETLTGGNSTVVVDVDVKSSVLWALNVVIDEIPGDLKENFVAVSSKSEANVESPIAYQHERYRVLDPEGLKELADVEVSLNENEISVPLKEPEAAHINERGNLAETRPTMMVSAALKMLLSTDQALEDAVFEAPQSIFPRGSEGLKRQGLRMAKPVSPHRSGLTHPLMAAEIVDISNESCRCPNCGNYLQTMVLSEEERHRVRVALMKIASGNSLNNCKNLQMFSEWLSTEEEFKFIVDGANVAYNRQNFNGGKFSYSQIELLVKRLQADYPGDRILVVLPYPYAQKIVPNSIHTSERRRLTYLSDADLAILEWLKKEKMLYVTSQGSDDDWYWMFATVNENRVALYMYGK